MTELAEKIQALRLAGKTYSEIVKEAKCARSLVAYYCGQGQKEKLKARTDAYKKARPLSLKVYGFTNRKKKQFDRHSEKHHVRGTPISLFTTRQLLQKVGQNPRCYLTGTPIDLLDMKTYEMDHIVPVSRGGTNELENCGICVPEANRAKSNMLLDEFLVMCAKILTYNGYQVTRQQ